MFSNVERKLKILAKFNLICGFILAGISFCWMMVSAGEEAGWGIVLGLLIAVIWVLVGFITSWPIYAFAEMVEGIKETNKTLKYIFQEDIRKFQGIEYEQEAQRRRAEQDRVDAQRRREEEQREAERLTQKAKEDRIAAYWAEHSEEMKALLAKKAEAEAKLRTLSSLAKEERQAIQELIQKIDYELARDR